MEPMEIKVIHDDGIYLIDKFCSDVNTADMEQQCAFNDMTINGSKLCRTGSLQGDQMIQTDKNGKQHKVTPCLRCPSIENCIVYDWSPIVAQIRDKIFNNFGIRSNLAKIQKYNDGNAIIASHSDKIIDLNDKIPIFVVRFGVDRTCVFTNKVNKQKINVNVGHGSLLMIKYDANLIWTHSIVKDDTPEISYSIIFRNVVTYHHPHGYIYGPNTPFKTLDDLLDFVSKSSLPGGEKLLENYYTKEEQRQQLTVLYARENNSINTIDLYKEAIEKIIYLY